MCPAPPSPHDRRQRAEDLHFLQLVCPPLAPPRISNPRRGACVQTFEVPDVLARRRTEQWRSV
jgi:hypothetical protein